MDSSPGLTSALLQWLNTAFNLPKGVDSLKDLEDGRILWRALQQVDPEHFTGSLPEEGDYKADDWIPKWQNLRFLERMATTYLRDECEQLENLSRGMNPDLQGAARGSPENMLRLLQTVMFAAMFSPSANPKMAEVMGRLSNHVQMEIARAITTAQELDTKLEQGGLGQDVLSEVESVQDVEPTRGGSFDRDPELEREERLIQEMQKNKQLADKVAQLREELRESEEAQEKLQDRVTALEDEVERRYAGVKTQDMDDYHQQSQSDRDLIAQLESDVQYHKSMTEDQERQLDRFKADASTKQELRDELQLVKAERDELLQRDKKHENLKKKIQVLQDQEKGSNALREQLDAATEQLQELEFLRDRVTRLQKANEESAKAIANAEQALFDHKTSQQRREHDYRSISAELQQLKEMNARLMEQNREQEDRIRELDGSGSAGGELGNLEDELDETEKPAPNKRESVRPSRPSTSANELVLQNRLSALDGRVKFMEAQCMSYLQENLTLNKILKDGKVEDEEQKTYFLDQKNRLDETVKELDETKSKLVALSSENADMQHRLAAAQTGDTNANVEALKENHERQKRVEELQQSLEEYKGMLFHAIDPQYSKRAAEIDTDIRETKEFKVILHQLGVVRDAPAADAPKIMDQTAASLADRQVRTWKDKQELQSINEEQSARIVSLQRELEQLKKAGPPSTLSAASQQELANLQRENKLLTSAWYDLTSRLQSNAVVLQRRGEAPKSWLGRQRVAVSQTGGSSVRR